MKSINDAIRSIFFNMAFFGTTALMMILTVPGLFMPFRVKRLISLAWFQLVYACEKYAMNLDYRVIGRENLPAEPYIIAAKHQSAWETMKIYKIFGDRSAIVAKKELMDIPIWGRYGRAMGLVPIDRSKGKEAMNLMIDSARRAVAEGRNIAVFPQGTRVKVGTEAPYKFGAIKLYEELNIPMVPVALNAGLFWPKNSFWKKSGVVTVEILPPIPPGLPPKEAFARLIEQTETATNRLCVAAGPKES